MIEPGEQAPDFTLPDQDGREVKLSDFRGTPVVVYFYPKADTPGCTTQACGVRDRQADYAGAHAAVFGISPDPVAKVKKFHDKQHLNFSLLADEGHASPTPMASGSRSRCTGRRTSETSARPS